MDNKEKIKNLEINQDIFDLLSKYEEFSQEIDEEIRILKSLTKEKNESIEILEEVIIESLGGYLVNENIRDTDGGMVDTIHNVRNGVEYKNPSNEKNYENREKYSSDRYHKHENYKNTNYVYKKKKKEGNLVDEYTGRKIDENEKFDLEHVFSAKEIHEDPGRILSELDGADLANRKDNLVASNSSTNRSKGSKNPEIYAAEIEFKKNEMMEKLGKLKNKDNLTDKELKERKKLEKLIDTDPKKIKEASKKSSKDRESEINKKYYAGSKFRNDTLNAIKNKSIEVAIKRSITEIMITGNREFLIYIKQNEKSNGNIFDFIGTLIRGFEKSVKKIFSELFDILKKVIREINNNILETVITIIINIFSTTITGVIKTVREIIAMISESKKSYKNITSKNSQERKKEFFSLILKGLLIIPLFNGMGLTQAIEKGLQNMGIPDILSDVLALGLASMGGSSLIFVIARLIQNIQIAIAENNIRKLEILNENMKMNIAAGNAIQYQYELQKVMRLGEKFFSEMNKKWEENNDTLQKEIERSDYIYRKIKDFRFSFNSISILDYDKLNEIDKEQEEIENILEKIKKNI